MLTKKEQTAHDATLKQEQEGRVALAVKQEAGRTKRSAKRAKTKR